MNKTIIAVVIVAVVVVGGYFLFRGAYQSTPSIPQTSNEQTVPQTSNQQTAPQSSTEQAPIAEKNEVIYTNAGYSPATLTIKKGETVTFKNQSSSSMWTASGIHPTHRLYPTTGGCIGSTFDTCKGVEPGDSWSFRFDISSTWKYHNHLSPSDTGTITVE